MNNASGRVVYLNGKLVPESQATISIYDSALMFGDMVFEMMRSFDKKHFELRAHLERLYASMNYVRIPLMMPIDEMERQFHAMVEANAHLIDKGDEYRTLINVSRGPLSLYRRIFDDKMEPTVVMSCFPLSWIIGASAKFYQTGVHAVVPHQKAIPADLLDPKVKNRSRLFYQMANQEAALVDKDAWALLLDPDNFIAEGTGSNFFLIKNGELFLPEPRNMLIGISMTYVIELAKKLKIPVHHRNMGMYELYTCDEAFFTCTPYSIMPCTKINGRPIGTGKPGELTMALLRAWSGNVGVDIVEQALQFGVKTATA